LHLRSTWDYKWVPPCPASTYFYAACMLIYLGHNWLSKILISPISLYF
jgi:hypothetical protein